MLSIAPPQQKGDIRYLPTVAEQVYWYGMGISVEKKARYTEDEHGVFNLNVDSLDAKGYEMDKQGLQMYVGRYITNAKVFLKNILYWCISSEWWK